MNWDNITVILNDLIMNRFISFLFLIILFTGCKKSESDFIWERSYGRGEAYFIQSSADSGFYACGESDGNPYFVRVKKNRTTLIDFKAERPGLFSSAWYDTSGYIAGGSTDGKMLLMRYSPSGNLLWEKTIEGGFKVDFTSLLYKGSGDFLAIGTASPDSPDSDPTGILFVRFDSAGQVSVEKNILATSFVPEKSFVSARGAVIDDDGNIFLALTSRQATGGKSKASVAKYNDQFQKIWETELYNNPDFGAASIAVGMDISGNINVSGKTELSTADGVLNNSFIASLTNSGSVRWKRYLENSNEGAAFIYNDAGEILMLNKNCFIINILDPSDGADAGRIRTLGLCDSYNSNALGTGLIINYDKNLLISGAYGGSFYIALKSAQN